MSRERLVPGISASNLCSDEASALQCGLQESFGIVEPGCQSMAGLRVILQGVHCQLPAVASDLCHSSTVDDPWKLPNFASTGMRHNIFLIP